jgi:hypothetical protein
MEGITQVVEDYISGLNLKLSVAVEFVGYNVYIKMKGCVKHWVMRWKEFIQMLLFFLISVPLQIPLDTCRKS